MQRRDKRNDPNEEKDPHHYALLFTARAFITARKMAVFVNAHCGQRVAPSDGGPLSEGAAKTIAGGAESFRRKKTPPSN
jgi:hypothetical protein